MFGKYFTKYASYYSSVSVVGMKHGMLLDWPSLVSITSDIGSFSEFDRISKAVIQHLNCRDTKTQGQLPQAWANPHTTTVADNGISGMQHKERRRLGLLIDLY